MLTHHAFTLGIDPSLSNPVVDPEQLSAFGRRILDLSFAVHTQTLCELRLASLTEELVEACERFVQRLETLLLNPEEEGRREEGVAIFEDYLELADSYDQLPYETVLAEVSQLEDRLTNHLLTSTLSQAA